LIGQFKESIRRYFKHDTARRLYAVGKHAKHFAGNGKHLFRSPFDVPRCAGQQGAERSDIGWNHESNALSPISSFNADDASG
jgi:hypothetical protein